MSEPEAQPDSLPIRGWPRDPIWQFIAVPVAVILGLMTIAWAVYAFVITKPVTSLACVVLSNSSLVQMRGDVSRDTTILYKGQPIHNLSIVTVKLENDGNQAIREADYAKPITFVFPVGSNIVDATVTDSNPPNVGVSVQANQNTATVSQSLLNPSDRAIMEFVIADLPGGAEGVPFALDARIVGVKSVVPISAIAETSNTGVLQVFMRSFLIFFAILSVFVLLYQSLRMLFLSKDRRR